MKTIYLFTILNLITLRIGAQKSLILKEVITKDLHQQFEKSNGQMNIILSYFEKNYKAVSEKLNVLIDEEMGGVECGYTKKFEFGIEYTYHNCGEARPVKERIILPKVTMTELRKWIEHINDAYPMDIKNIWYEGGNEYGPEDKEAGCYYNILPSAKNSVIEVWCGS